MNTTSRTLACLILAALLPAARAQWIVLDDAHTDLCMDFNPATGSWNAYLDHEYEGLCPFSRVLFHARDLAWPSGSRLTRPAGTTWDFLGMAAGAPIWIFPQTQQAGILWPGFSSHVPLNTYAAYSEPDPRVSAVPTKWISHRLRDVRFSGVGAGHVSVWTTGSGGIPTVWMDTADGIADEDRFLLPEGGHIHVNWGFSDVGWYEFDFEATGYLSDMTYTNSPLATLYVGVGTIQEPRFTQVTPTQALINVTGTNLVYQLQISSNLFDWSDAESPSAGTGTNLWLTISSNAAPFIRYRAGHPPSP